MFIYAVLVLCIAQFSAGLPADLSARTADEYNYEQCPTLWKKLGCRVDYHRNMTALINDHTDPNKTINWDNWDGYVYDLACRCRRAAIAAGNCWFALENYGICFSASGPLSRYLDAYPLDEGHNCVGAIKHNKTIVSQIDGEICVGGYSRAFFYNMTDNCGSSGGSVGAAPAAAPAEKEDEVEKCQDVSDVLMLVDVSGSVGDDNFKRVQEFLQKFMDAYDFSNGKSRFGIITFDEKCYVDLTWIDSNLMSLPQIRDKINALKYTKGSTLTDNALKCAREKIILPFQRQNIPKTIIVLTDGQSWNGLERLPGPSQQLRGMGCKLLAIGIGQDVDPNELKIITGDLTKVFLLDSFANLIQHAARHVNKLLSKACVS